MASDVDKTRSVEIVGSFMVVDDDDD